ncbi:hypothetical protein GCM10008012_58360 [Rhizobium anhuiense]|nr:hypothetical protein GCM10008012_58360 [Rhizobium anhuiense]
MGDVVEKPLLRLLKLLQSRCRGIEVVRECGDLVLSAGHFVSDTNVETAMGKRAQAVTQVNDWTNEISGERDR